MVVYHPFNRDANRFIEEIEAFFKGNFVFDAYYNHKKYTFDICHIHWPEALTEWQEPSRQELEEIKEFLSEINTPVIYTVHNEYPHRGNSKNFQDLYDAVINRADCILHFGEFSLTQFKKSYPEKSHAITHHPLYFRLPNNTDKRTARQKLNLKLEEKIILVFGSLRNSEEEMLITKTFDFVKVEQKKLIITRWRDLVSQDRKGWKRSLSYRIRKRHFSSDQFKFQNQFIRENDIQLYFNAADILLLPRITQLNSGLIYLAATFGTPVVGINSGNIGSELNDFGYVACNSEPEEIGQVIMNMLNHPCELNVEKLKLHRPENVAKEYQLQLEKLIGHIR